MVNTVQTVLGPRPAGDLGVTLMHEHLLIGWPGWELDRAAPRFDRQEARQRCVERMLELRELGLTSLVDPCPMDLGRDVEFIAEVAQASGTNIVCATGLYKEEEGATPYFRFRSAFADVVAEMTESFVQELTVGIGSSGIRPGVIKVATGLGRITAYEEKVLRAASRAHLATGAPITTHTDRGTMGRQQLDIFAEEGVDASRVIIGHSCGTADLAYHVDLLDRGAYLGFDRFGLEMLQPDRLRLASLIGLLGIDFHERIVLSHDSVWCWLGRPPLMPPEVARKWNPRHVFETILPALRDAGVTQAKIDAMLIGNPRRYFEGSSRNIG